MIAAYNSDSTNPFTVMREIVGWLGFVVGYSPKVIERTTVAAKQYKLESQKEIEESGRANEISFRANKLAGHKKSKEDHQAAIDESRAAISKLSAIKPSASV